jgi:hypothetical protein
LNASARIFSGRIFIPAGRAPTNRLCITPGQGSVMHQTLLAAHDKLFAAVA